MSIWYIFLYQPLVNVLMFMYQALGGNLGVAIIATTILVRLVLIPLTMPGMKSAAKMQELKPELDKLKKKYGDDKQGLAQAQLALYREHNINPFGSLLPTIIQFLLLIALFQVFTSTLKPGSGIGEINKVLYPFIRLADNAQLNTQFLYLDVTRPDMFNLPNSLLIGPITISAIPGFFLIAAVVVQYLSSKVMLASSGLKTSKKTGEGPAADDMVVSMQKQMMVIGPLMTLLIGIRFPSGMVLYWVVISLSMIVQQWAMKRGKTSVVNNS